MLGLHVQFSQDTLVLMQLETLPTTDEFIEQVTQYEGDAYNYFLLIMGVTVVTTFIRGLMS